MQIWLAAVNDLDGVRQLLHIDIFQQIAIRAGLHRAQHQLGVGECRERDNPHVLADRA